VIVPMRKVFIVARARDRERLLDRVRDLGVVHLVPADPNRAAADDHVLHAIQQAERALQVLSGVAPEGPPGEIPPAEAVHEVLETQRRAAEGQNRLASLYHLLEVNEIWGNLELAKIELLRAAGVEVQFYSVPREAVDRIEAECAAVVGSLPGRRAMVAVATRGSEPHVPEGAEPMPLPQRDAPSIRAEAAEIDAALKRDARRLAELAWQADAIRAELTALRRKAEYDAALRGAAARDELFAIQGWVPAERSGALGGEMGAAGIPAAVETFDPAPDENPPTLIRPPAWARPIEDLFKMLGTVAGYREFDVSVPFLIALPIFTAMLIADGGYGAVILLACLVFYHKAAKTLGARFTQLMIVVGTVTIGWGFLCGSFFGKVLYDPPIPVDLTDASRELMMWLSFVIGAIHLSLAQSWRAVRLFPDLRFLNKVGWAMFIWGMFGVVKFFVLKAPLGWDVPWPYLLIGGGTLAVLFHEPSRNPIKTLGLGLANFPLSMLSAFSDVISYVRLMAVGLASSVLAVSFNNMAADLGWWPLAAVVLLLGHSLNLGLALIAMFAHGVRLNMLEFCNNLGVEWTGYAYHPFLTRSNGEP
jgi:V/A-type H+/Na+-transporting ATPase subunit I